MSLEWSTLRFSKPVFTIKIFFFVKRLWKYAVNDTLILTLNGTLLSSSNGHTHKSDKNLWQFYCPHNYCTVWSYLFVRSCYESCINRCSNIKCHPMKCLQSTNIVIQFLGKYCQCIHSIFTSIFLLYNNF